MVLLIGHVALTSFSWRTYWVVGTAAYSLNNLILGYYLGLGFGLGLRTGLRIGLGLGLGCGIVWYVYVQTAVRTGGLGDRAASGPTGGPGDSVILCPSLTLSVTLNLCLTLILTRDMFCLVISVQ